MEMIGKLIYERLMTQWND